MGVEVQAPIQSGGVRQPLRQDLERIAYEEGLEIPGPGEEGREDLKTLLERGYAYLTFSIAISSKLLL